MKLRLFGFALVALPALALAAGETPANPPAHKMGYKHAAMKMTDVEITLVGSTDANRVEIEKLAKEAVTSDKGTTVKETTVKASLDTKTGMLKISFPQKDTFNKEKFKTELSKVAGVSLKE